MRVLIDTNVILEVILQYERLCQWSIPESDDPSRVPGIIAGKEMNFRN